MQNPKETAVKTTLPTQKIEQTGLSITTDYTHKATHERGI